MEFWEPKHQPPHPSTVSDLSEHTQKIMKALEKNCEAAFLKNKPAIAGSLVARTPQGNGATENYYQHIYAARFGSLLPPAPLSMPYGSQSHTSSSSMPPPDSSQIHADYYKYRPQVTSWNSQRSQPFHVTPNNMPLQYGRNFEYDRALETPTNVTNPQQQENHSGTPWLLPSKSLNQSNGLNNHYFEEPQAAAKHPQQGNYSVTGHIRQPFGQHPETVTRSPMESCSTSWQSHTRVQPPSANTILSEHIMNQISQTKSPRKYVSPVMDFGSDEEGRELTQTLTQRTAISTPHSPPYFSNTAETRANKPTEMDRQYMTPTLNEENSDFSLHTPQLHRSHPETTTKMLHEADQFIDLTQDFDSPMESSEINSPTQNVMEVGKLKAPSSRQSSLTCTPELRKPLSPKEPISVTPKTLSSPHRISTPDIAMQNMNTTPQNSTSSKLQATTEDSSKNSKRKSTHHFDFSNKKKDNSKHALTKNKQKYHGNVSKAKAMLIESILQPNSHTKNISCNDRPVKDAAKKEVDKIVASEDKSQGLVGRKSKKKFNVPLKSQQTQPSNIEAPQPKEKFKITALTHKASQELDQQIQQKPPIEICITIMYKAGNCQLSRTCDDVKRHKTCSPQGLMLAVLGETDPVTFYVLPLQENAPLEPQKSLLHNILLAPCRKVCFKSQELFVYLIHIFNFQYQEVSLKWIAIDPLIGCWLLNPDQPPTDFNEVLKCLGVSKKQDNSTKSQDRTCKNLVLLSKAVETMYQKLTDQELWRVFIDLESKVTSILAVMEMEGIPTDKHVLKDIGSNLELKIKSLQSQANKLMGVPVLLTSPQQLRKILYDQLKLDSKIKIPMTLQGGGKSTSETVLKLLESLHPLPGIILEFRHCQKLKSTYVDGILQYVSGGKLYTTWEQIGTSTGRVISRDPNVQAIPKQSIPGEVEDKEIFLRSAFKSKAGHSFLAADFQHIELRLLAHFAQDKTLSSMFAQTEQDVFQLLARQWLGLSTTREVTSEQREHTKRVVYSVMYGAGAGKLEQVLKVDAEEARRILGTFSVKFPQIRNFSKYIVRKAKDQGYLTSLSGRRRFFPNIGSSDMKIRSQSERQAMNFIIQGSAADVCKAAMIATEHTQHQVSPPVDARLLLQIHDELIWQVPDSQLAQFKEIVQKAMEGTRNQFQISLPLPVALGSGKTWADLQ